MGNLATGGTGKTPMTEYLVELLKDSYLTATLSRGYKRKTTGFAIAGENTTAIDIGDEPMQFHQKYPGLIVAVGEERLVAIPQLLHDRPGIQVIILDDAFQHRTVRPGLNILLTECKNLYTKDLLLPAGDLRDVKASSKRADIIIVTKTNPDLSVKEKQNITNDMQLLVHQTIFFTEIVYGHPYHLFKNIKINLTGNLDCLLLCGIANPKPLEEFLDSQVQSVVMLQFPDHHIFKSDDLTNIKKQFDKIVSENKIIITTEKDAVRLQKYKNELATFPIYVLPIKHHFLFGDAEQFQKRVIAFIESFTKSV